MNIFIAAKFYKKWSHIAVVETPYFFVYFFFWGGGKLNGIFGNVKNLQFQVEL